MTTAQETRWLFAGIVAVLAVASLAGFALSRRHAATGPNPTIENLNARINAWWVMVALIGLAFVFGKAGVIALFGFASFAALREFITLTPTRRAITSRWPARSSSCCRCSIT
jgi:phosphatidate cytidylyltransferase